MYCNGSGRSAGNRNSNDNRNRRCAAPATTAHPTRMSTDQLYALTAHIFTTPKIGSPNVALLQLIVPVTVLYT